MAYSRQGPALYYSRKLGYFLQVLDFEPLVLDGKGNRRPPSEFKELNFQNEKHRDVALCALNSSLFYWFVTVFSDCRHLNKREIDGFPLDVVTLGEKCGGSLTKLARRLMRNLRETSEERTMRFQHDHLTVQCILPRFSKPILDEIDAVLAEYYGFSPVGLDFIVNYDIKYRLGQGEAETVVA